MLREQTREACRALPEYERDERCATMIRAEVPEAGPLLPSTYEWIKRLDRDLGLFGDPE